MLLRAYVSVRTWGQDLRERLMGEGGVTTTEYVLLVVLIGLVIAAGATVLANALNDKFGDACTGINASTSCTP